MPKLPALTAREVIRLLEQKGFLLDRTRGSHHVYYHPQTKRRVVVAYHPGDLPKGTLFEILRQAGLTREELRDVGHV
jgi:predicted RNA binding protein YcfA (HicA-like mRNA interferase family)